ncbi:MAG: DUF4292 domain-containing protein [Nitrospirae bacterium]|nr:DUF4292 domain-containing protein [Nitrospirota bacterium]
MFFFLVFLFSCAPKAVKPTELIQPQEANLSELISILEKRDSDIKTIRSLVRVEAKNKAIESAPSFDAVLLMEKPNNIRFQGLSPFGVSIFDFVSTDGQMKVFLPTKNMMIVGPVELLNKIPESKMPMRFNDFFEGLGTSAAYLKKPNITVLAEKLPDYYIVYVAEKENGSRGERPFAPTILKKKIWFDRRGLKVVREELFGKNGEKEMEILFDAYKKTNDISFPMQIRINKLRDNSYLKINFKQIAFNSEIRPEDFKIEIGEGVEVRMLEEIINKIKE